MKAITLNYNSRSSGAKYQAKRDREGKISCNCRGWIYNRKCWHTTRIEEMK